MFFWVTKGFVADRAKVFWIALLTIGVKIFSSTDISNTTTDNLMLFAKRSSAIAAFHDAV